MTITQPVMRETYIAQKLHYKVQKVDFQRYNDNFAILLSASSSSNILGTACLYGTVEDAELDIDVRLLYQNQGIEAHFLFHVFEIAQESQIAQIRVTLQHDEEALLSTLLAMGFDINDGDNRRLIELCYRPRSH